MSVEELQRIANELGLQLSDITDDHVADYRATHKVKGCKGCKFSTGIKSRDGIGCKSAQHIYWVYRNNVSVDEISVALEILDTCGSIDLWPWEETGDEQECPHRREAE